LSFSVTSSPKDHQREDTRVALRRRADAVTALDQQRRARAMDAADDHQAALARFAELWSRSAQAHHAWNSWKPVKRAEGSPATPSVHEPIPRQPTPGAKPAEPRDEDRVGGRDFTRFDAAARSAQVAFPGPIGELISREISAYLSFGFYFDAAGGLISELVDHVLATELPTELTTEPTSAKE
jgi:hypothetical protein